MTKRKFLSSALLLIMILSLVGGGVYADSQNVVTAPGTGVSDITLTVEATAFSVTVPMTLPVAMDSNGEVTTATTAKIINNSYGQVIVTNAEITGTGGWSIVAFDSNFEARPVGSKALGFKINEDETIAGELDFVQSHWTAIDGNSTLLITYDAKLPAQKTAIGTASKIADIVFTIGWKE